MRKPSMKSKTDWERVKHEADTDTPIPFSPEDDPYDPNDTRATEEFLTSAVVRDRREHELPKSPSNKRVVIRVSPK